MPTIKQIYVKSDFAKANKNLHNSNNWAASDSTIQIKLKHMSFVYSPEIHYKSTKNWAGTEKRASQASVYDCVFEFTLRCRSTAGPLPVQAKRDGWIADVDIYEKTATSLTPFSASRANAWKWTSAETGLIIMHPRWELCGAFWEISTTECQPVCWTPAQRLSQEQDKLLHCPQTTPKLSVTSKNRTNIWGYQKHVLHPLFSFQYELRLTFWLYAPIFKSFLATAYKLNRLLYQVPTRSNLTLEQTKKTEQKDK